MGPADIRLLNGEAVSRFFKNNVVTFMKAERVQSHETNLGSEKKSNLRQRLLKKNFQFVSFRKSIFVWKRGNNICEWFLFSRRFLSFRGNERSNWSPVSPQKLCFSLGQRPDAIAQCADRSSWNPVVVFCSTPPNLILLAVSFYGGP